jgi:hypothetical protein
MVNGSSIGTSSYPLGYDVWLVTLPNCPLVPTLSLYGPPTLISSSLTTQPKQGVLDTVSQTSQLKYFNKSFCAVPNRPQRT